MNSTNLQNEEYTMQYLTISPTEFCEHVKHHIKRNVILGVDEIKSVVSSSNFNLDNKANTLPALDELKRRCLDETERVVASKSEEIIKLISVPKNALLATDTLHKKPYSQETINTLQKEVKSLEELLIQNEAFIALLNEENELLDQLQAVQESVTENIKQFKTMEAVIPNVDHSCNLLVKHSDLCRQNFGDDENLDAF